METVVITGGTGLVGSRLSQMLAEAGYHVIVLTRNALAKPVQPDITYAVWDVSKQQIDAAAVAAADHIVHLAGEGVADKRWSGDRKQAILDSRIKSSDLLVHALTTMPNRVKTVVSASAIGWYGEDTPSSRSAGFTEDAAPDINFLGETCRLWEEHISPVKRLGKRLVIYRTGIVLSDKGGALKEFSKPLRAGVAAILGTGKQVVSWIHIDDLCRMYMNAISDTALDGVYNAVAPHPVTNKALTITLADLMRGKYYVPVHVPVFALKIALGEMSIEVLKSATVSSRKVQLAGFDFLYPLVREALAACLSVQK